VKKIGTVGLILVFSQLVLLGPLFLFQQNRWQEHMMTEIKRNLEDFEAEELYFSNAQFNVLNWHEGKREFSLGGKFYDVIEIKHVYGGIVIKCVNDKEEALLVKRYIDSGKGQSNPLHDLVKGICHSFAFEELDLELTPILIPLSLNYIQNSAYFYSVKESIKPCQSPPPNFI